MADLSNLWKPTQQVHSFLGSNPELQPIADQPTAKWVNNQSDADGIGSLVSQAAGKTLVLCVYAIPGRDAGGYSGGGFPDRASYLTFINTIKSQLGTAQAVIAYEPDALGLSDGSAFSAAARDEMRETLRQGIAILATIPNAETFLDASMWIDPGRQASLLQSVNISQVAGFCINISAYNAQSTCYTYGNNVMTSLSGVGVTGKTFIIDSSRNGHGPLTEADRPLGSPWLDSNQPWCNPPKRALGLSPGVVTGQGACRANLWIKAPGESDGNFPSTSQSSYYGSSAPNAGTFWIAHARDLLKLSPVKTNDPVPPPPVNRLTLNDIVASFDTEWGPFQNRTAPTSLSGGRARIPVATSYENIETPKSYSAKDSLISARVYPGAIGGATVEASTLFAINSPTAGTRLSIVIDRVPGIIRFGAETGYWDAANVSITYDPVAHAWLRFREQAGTLYFETSADGTTWVQRRTVPTPGWVTMTADSSVQFLGFRNDGTITYTEVDNVNVAPGTTTTEPVSTSLSTTLTGLTEGAKYSVRVRAKNSAGVGPWSLPHEFSFNAPADTTQPVLSSTATVNFASALPDSALAAGMSYGSCISTYGAVNIIKGGAAERDAYKAALGRLGPSGYRIPLAWNGGAPGSSAGGARSYGDAGQYIQAIRDIGGTPIIAVGGGTADNDILASDAAALVRYFNDNGGQNGGPVTNWIIGNEPDNGFGVDPYIYGGTGRDGRCDGFNAIAAAMRAATTLKLTLSGPTFVTWADYKTGDYNNFLDHCGAQVDIVDFHAYDGDNLPLYTNAMNWIKGAIEARASTRGRVKVHCGELNYHSFYAEPNWGANQFWTSVNTVMIAASMGRVIEKGGRAYQYSDNNGPLGMITPGDANNGAPNGLRIPMPAYFGVKMWTGGNLFRQPTGAMATCSTTHPDTDVFASTGNKNVLFINRSYTTDRAVTLGLTGVPTSGTYEIWQTQKGMNPTDTAGNQWKEPVKVKSGTYVNGQVTFTAPSLTVSTIVVGV